MSKLFTPYKINHLELPNRIIIAPMCQYSAENGKATPWHTMHYGNLSHSGAGLLIFEATAVEPEGRISYQDLGLYNDECEKALSQTVQNIKIYSNMPLAIQLAHAGRKASTDVPWKTHKQIKSDQLNGWKTVAPSSVSFNSSDEEPHE